MHLKTTHKFSARYRLRAATSRISDESVESAAAVSWISAIIFHSVRCPRRSPTGSDTSVWDRKLVGRKLKMTSTIDDQEEVKKTYNRWLWKFERSVARWWRSTSSWVAECWTFDLSRKCCTLSCRPRLRPASIACAARSHSLLRPSCVEYNPIHLHCSSTAQIPLNNSACRRAKAWNPSGNAPRKCRVRCNWGCRKIRAGSLWRDMIQSQTRGLWNKLSIAALTALSKQHSRVVQREVWFPNGTRVQINGLYAVKLSRIPRQKLVSPALIRIGFDYLVNWLDNKLTFTIQALIVSVDEESLLMNKKKNYDS